MPESLDKKLEIDLKRSLGEAIKAAFPKRDHLASMVEDELYESLDDITFNELDYKIAIRNLVGWAQTEGKLCDLVIGAARQKPGNPKLRNFTTENLKNLLVLDRNPEPKIKDLLNSWITCLREIDDFERVVLPIYIRTFPNIWKNHPKLDKEFLMPLSTDVKSLAVLSLLLKDYPGESDSLNFFNEITKSQPHPYVEPEPGLGLGLGLGLGKRILFHSAKCCAIVLLAFAFRGLGVSRPLDFFLYDQFMARQQSSQEKASKDAVLPSVTVVSITSDFLDGSFEDDEGNIVKNACGGVHICDSKLQSILEGIRKISPRSLIGLDILRDLNFTQPGEESNLWKYLNSQDNIIYGCVSRDRNDQLSQIGEGLLLPSFPKEKTGFLNFPLDRKRMIRRYTLAVEETRDVSDQCIPQYSLALQLLLKYFDNQGATYDDVKFGNYSQIVFDNDVEIHPLASTHHSAYSPKTFNNEGFQILINYQELSGVEERFANDILAASDSGKQEDLGDIVLIGYDLESNNADPDLHPTSVGEMAGVYIHATVLKQLAAHSTGNTDTIIDPLFWQDEYFLLAFCLGAIYGVQVLLIKRLGRDNILPGIIFLGLGSSVAVVALPWAFFLSGIWWPTGSIILGIFLIVCTSKVTSFPQFNTFQKY